MKSVVITLIVGSLAGCGLSHQVDSDLLREITIEQRLLLFEAENDLSIAIDGRDRIRRQLRKAKAELRSTEAQIEEAENDEDRAGAKGDDQRQALAALAGDVFDLKRDYVLGKVDALREKREVQESVIVTAQAQFELAKAKLIVDNKARGASSIDIEDFQDQANDALEDAQAALANLKEAENEVEALREVWLAQRAALGKASGGGVGSPWAEVGGFGERARTIRALDKAWRTDR